MSELRQILGETVTRLFADHCTKERLEKAEKQISTPVKALNGAPV